MILLRTIGALGIIATIGIGYNNQELASSIWGTVIGLVSLSIFCFLLFYKELKTKVNQ